MDQASSPEYDRDLSAEDRDRLFKEQYARALADMRYGMGPLSVAPVFSPDASGAKVSANVAGVEPYVVIDPSTGRPVVVEQGVTYGSGTPESGYQLRYSKNERTGQPVYSGAYRRRLDRDSEITAQGSYVPMPGRDAYQAMLQYRKRFAEGGEAKTDDDPIRKLYRETLAREADTGGLEYWRKEFGPEVDVAERMRFIEGAQPEVQKRMAAGDTTLPAYMRVAPEVRSALQSTDVTTDEYKRLANYFGNQWIAGEAEDPASLTRRDYIERPRSGYDLATFLATRSQQHGAQADTAQRLSNLLAPYMGNVGKATSVGGESLDQYVVNPLTGQTEIAQPLGVDNTYRIYRAPHHGSIGDTGNRYAVGMDYRVDPATGQTEFVAPYASPYTDTGHNDWQVPLGILGTAAGMYFFPGMDFSSMLSRGAITLATEGAKRAFKHGGEVTNFVKRRSGSPEEGEVAEQMTVGTRLTDQEMQQPSVSREAFEKFKATAPAVLGIIPQAANTVAGNILQGITDPKAHAKRSLENIAKQLRENPEEFVMNWTGGGLGGIIRPKGGGNLLSGEVERTIESLRPTFIVPDNKGQPVKIFASEQAESLRDLIARQKSGNYSSEYGESILKEIEPQAALDDWIKDKLGGYIKKQMGTEDDPIRKLADEMDTKIKADYQAGLKRIAKMKDDIAKAKARGKNTDVSEAELADEIERVEEAFQNASALPVKMPPYTHVSPSAGKAREKAGFSSREIAQTREGKSYEQMADVSFIPMTRKEVEIEGKVGRTMGRNWAAFDFDPAQNQWISKLGEEDIVYRVRSEDINERAVFTHTIDELSNALNPASGLPQNLLLKPEDMQGLGIEKAFRHVNKINDWRAQQRAAASLEEAKRSAVTIKEYPDTPKRLQWQQLKPVDYTELPPGYRIEDIDYGTSVLKGPDGSNLTYFDKTAADAPDVMKQALSFLSKNDLEKALQYEGSTMRHCVGSYCNSVWTGETNIFSLRDRKGEPHVTIETAPPDIRRDGNTPLDFLIENPSMASRVGVNEIDLAQMNVSKDLDQRATELGIGRMPSVLSVETNRNIIKLPEFQEWLRSKPSEILQIKGKGNAKPKEDYIPFVQDFIKSQQWSHIGDISNTDLVTLKPGLLKNARDRGFDVNVITEQNGNTYITKQEFNRLANLFGGMNVYPN